MEVTEVVNEGLKREFQVTLLAKDLNKQVEDRIKKLARDIKMPGFRPGKVPVSIVRKKHGKSVLGEVLEHAVADSSEKILSDKKLIPALQPKIEVSSYDTDKQISDLVYNISFEIYPDIPELELSKIKVKRNVVDISEKDLEKGLDNIRRARVEFVPLKKARAAKKGDAVIIDFEGKVDGAVFEGGTSKDFQLELGSNQFIPGYEDQLVGVKKGEKRVVKVKFPDNYGKDELAGKDAEFSVDVHDVLQPKLPEVNDEFASSFGFENLEVLKEELKQQLMDDFESVTRTHLKKELFDSIDKLCDFNIPQGMVELEIKSINESLGEESKKTDKKKQKEYKELAERRVRLGVLFADIGRKNAINVTEDEVRKAVFDMARNYPGQEQSVIDYYRQNDEALEMLKGPILEEKVVDFIINKVNVTDKKITSEELEKLEEAEE